MSFVLSKNNVLVAAVACGGLLISPRECLSESLQHGDRTVSHTEGEQIYISQCAVTVCVFALELFHVHYDVNTLATSLSVSEQGVAMSDVRDVLGAHRLDVQARADVSLSRLEESLLPGRIAILPLKSQRNLNHYFVAMRDRSGQPVLVDVLAGVKRLREAMTEDALRDAGGLVLFVSRYNNASTGATIAEFIDIEPERIELGVFPVTGPSAAIPVSRTLTIRNTSTQSFMASSIVTSCGCTRPDWVGGMLYAEQERKVEFSVIPGAWGVGASYRTVKIEFPDKSSKVVEIHGIGEEAAEMQGLDVDPRKRRVDISELDREDDEHVSFIVSGSTDSLDRVSVEKSPEWLALTCGSIADGAMRLHGRIRFDHSMVLDVLSGERVELSGSILLNAGNDESPQIPVRVDLYSRPPVLSPSVVAIKPGETKSVIVHATQPESARTRSTDVQEYLDVETVASDLSVSIVGTGADRGLLTIVATERVAPGIEVVRCKCIFRDGSKRTGKLLVRILGKRQAVENE